MRRIWTGLTIVFACLVALPAWSQSAHKFRRDGDLMYDQREFQNAEEAYRKANDKEYSPEITYNLGNTIYNQERYDEALKQYSQAAENASDPELKAKALYNLGNTYMGAQDLENAVKSYIESLKIKPEDTDTKKNLTLALQKLKQQQQQQQQQQQNDENKNEDQQEEQKDQGGEGNEEQQQEQQQSPQQEEQQDGEEQQQPMPEPGELTREEAEELLRIIENEDQRVQQKLRKGDAKGKKPKKDW